MACTRCGTAELPGKTEIESLARQIAATRERTDGEQNAPQELVSRRTAVCAACEALAIEVLCSHCGCFVAVRALDKKRKCPHPEGNRWDFPHSDTPAAPASASRQGHIL